VLLSLLHGEKSHYTFASALLNSGIIQLAPGVRHIFPQQCQELQEIVRLGASYPATIL
jgi:hypothetical protein